MTVEVRSSIQELPRIDDRITFFHLEHCIVHVDGGAITASSQDGFIKIPAAAIGCLLFGTGTSVTHDAMKLLAQCSTPVMWVGSDDTRLYSYCINSRNGLSSSSKYSERQAEIVSHPKLRIAAAKRMYRVRYGEDIFGTSPYTMNQLRALEGARVKRTYLSESKRTGVRWVRRNAEFKNIDDDDIVNKAITLGTQILYNLELAVVISLGAVPSLGVIHCGKSLSFIYDMSDLYKEKFIIPMAFNYASENIKADSYELDRNIRKLTRQVLADNRIVEMSIRDIKNILFDNEDESLTEVEWMDGNSGLWAPDGIYASGRNYGKAS